jgi:hypothetical protein
VATPPCASHCNASAQKGSGATEVFQLEIVVGEVAIAGHEEITGQTDPNWVVNSGDLGGRKIMVDEDGGLHQALPFVHLLLVQDANVALLPSHCTPDQEGVPDVPLDATDFQGAI